MSWMATCAVGAKGATSRGFLTLLFFRVGAEKIARAIQSTNQARATTAYSRFLRLVVDGRVRHDGNGDGDASAAQSRSSRLLHSSLPRRRPSTRVRGRKRPIRC
ncbi:hypothetical protein HYPGJ_20069 [Hyphomicrobium sp. GJ21]|nr:hypothetical protein HYPGJ_20069 [Hyphomicrobium sp. GJ21]